MTRPIRLAIIGVGRWGVHLLRNFLALPQAEVVAVVDSRPEQLAQVRQKFDLPDTVTYFEQWQDALTLPDLEALVVVTPAASHGAVIKAALEKGLHVLTEKPMTLTAAECQQLCQLAEQQQRQIVVDHTYLFHPAVQQGQSVVQAGKVGQLRYGYSARTNLGPVRPDVDALWDLAIHDVTLFNHWLGAFPTHVVAWGNCWLQPEAQPPFVNGLCDTGWLLLTYPSGFQAQIHVSWLNPDKQRRLAVVGDQGTLVFDELSPPGSLTLYQGQFQREETRYLPTPITPLSMPVPAAEPLKQVCLHFLDCVQANQPSSLSSGAMASQLVALMESVTQSCLAGGIPVAVPPVDGSTHEAVTS